ncbi:hypothetical protein [Paenibacillus amylolyticus]|uniref:Uncharacterized protein n=1 Tax=Paenibacillus amylolyticus TaxID=1451 RepID=A0ABD8AYK0_PAEAM
MRLLIGYISEKDGRGNKLIFPFYTGHSDDRITFLSLLYPDFFDSLGASKTFKAKKTAIEGGLKMLILCSCLQTVCISERFHQFLNFRFRN